MVYITQTGEVNATRSKLRASYLVELFWAIVNFIGLFFSTLLGDGKKKAGTNTTTERRFQPRRPGVARGNIRGISDINRGSGCVPGGS